VQSGACLPCDPAQAWSAWSPGAKAGLLIGSAFAGIIIVAFVFLQPIAPPLERAAAWASAIGGKVVKRATCGMAGESKKSVDKDAGEQKGGSEQKTATDNSADDAQANARLNLEVNAAFDTALVTREVDAEMPSNFRETATQENIDFMADLQDTLDQIKQFAKILMKCVP
jgi:hypothetical protein